MSDAPPPTTSLEAIGAHIWHLQQSQAQTNSLLAKMATHEDIKGIHATIATLATRSELDQKIAALDKRITDSTPSSLMAGVATFATRVLVIVALLGLVGAGVRWADHLPFVVAAKP